MDSARTPLIETVNLKKLFKLNGGALLHAIRQVARDRAMGHPLAQEGVEVADHLRKERDPGGERHDRLGHDAGDVALVHLANIARACMRPTDTLARYGGEEFVILMPDTTLAQGVEIMTRLQRELTKAIFMSGSERVLITFSAGVAQLTQDEDGNDAIRRADQAMYLAKRAGKNRVLGA